MKRLRDLLCIGWFRAKYALMNDDGISVVELILVLVVVIGLVIIFKTCLLYTSDAADE